MLIPLLSAGNFVIGMGAFMVIGMLNPMAEGFGITPAEAGFVLTVYALAYAVSSPLAVALTGRWPRRRVLVWGIAIFGATALASALVSTPAALYATRALGAVGAGVFTPVAAAVAAAASAPEARGRALARVFFGLTLAQVLGVPLGSYLAYSVGWHASFVLVAVLSAACAAALLRAVPGDLPFTPTSLRSLGAALRDWRVLVAVSYTATFLGSIYVLFTYLAPLLAATMGLGRDGISALLLLYGFGAVSGNIAGGRLSDRLGPLATLALLVAAQAALMPLFSLLPLPWPVLVVLVFVWPAFGWSFIAPQQSRLIGLAPAAANVLLSLNAAAIYVGAALGSAVGAGVIAHGGVERVGLVAGLCALGAGLHLWLSARATRGFAVDIPGASR